jgi:hypothetical protein
LFNFGQACQRSVSPALSNAAVSRHAEGKLKSKFCRSVNTFWKEIEAHLIIHATVPLPDALVQQGDLEIGTRLGLKYGYLSYAE